MTNVNDRPYNRVISYKIKRQHLLATTETLNKMLALIEKLSPEHPDLIYSTTLGMFMCPTLSDCNDILILDHSPGVLAFLTYKTIDDVIVANTLYNNRSYDLNWITSIPLSDMQRQNLKVALKEDSI